MGEAPRNDEEVMLARQGPWQACLRGGGEEQPLETLEAPGTQVISAPAAALCTLRPRVQAQPASLLRPRLGRSSPPCRPAYLGTCIG